MKIISVTFLVQFVLLPLTIVPTIGSAEVILQHDLHSVSMASEENALASTRVDALASTRVDATGSDELPRALKKAKGTAKDPKSGKGSKSAKGSASSSPPTSQESSQPSDDPCASISTEKDALLALKAGFTNGEDQLSDWIDSTDPCTGDTSNWGDHITCSGGEVTEIDLGKCNLF